MQYNSSNGPLVTIPFDHTVKQAFELMSQWGVRHLPVTDGAGQVVGVLSDLDICRAMNPLQAGFKEGFLVADFMSWPAITVRENESMGRVASVMSAEKVSSLLVTNAADELVGIVTSDDLLRLMADKYEQKKEIFSFAYAPLLRETLRDLESVGI